MVITALNLKELQKEIERMRLKWMDIVLEKGLLSTEAIQTGQALDNKIHEYYCLQKRLLIDNIPIK
jgi:hypothetical protein